MSIEQQLREFPADPLEDVTPLGDGESSLGYSLYSANTHKSFNLASKDLAQHRPVIPSSEVSVVRIIPKTNKVQKHEEEQKSINQESIKRSSSSFNQHKLEQLPPKTDPYELVKLCRQGWTLSKGIAKKPVIAKIDPALVQRDIQKFSQRKERATKIHEQNPVSFGHSERYEPAQWPSNDTVSLASGRKGNNERNLFNFSSPHYYNHRESSSLSPFHGKAYSFAREPRMPTEPPRSPGPIYDVSKSTQAVLPHHPISSLDCSGRVLLGSIYWDQFNLKSAGNYYHGQEAYLNHTTAPAALPSPTPVFPPKEDSKKTRSMKEQVRKNLNPITPLVHTRSDGTSQVKEKDGYYHRSHHRGKKGLL